PTVTRPVVTAVHDPAPRGLHFRMTIRKTSCPLGLYLLRQIDRAAYADVVEMSVEEAARSAATVITKHFEEIVVGVELALRIERLGGVLERDPVHINATVLARPYAAWQSTLINQPGDELDRAQFAHERGIERDFVQTAHDLLVRGRIRVALQRIDL